jgi:single-strand DNA-binding protein
VEQTDGIVLRLGEKQLILLKKYVVKGKEIGIEGKLTHRSYDDKNGEKRYVTELLLMKYCF